MPKSTEFIVLTIRQFEELSLNALPSFETIYYDGWLLRFAGGYPRRANSIQLLYPSLLPLDEKIAYCEAQYRSRGFKTVFKLTDHAPAGLAAALVARGYVEDAATTIQTLDLAAFTPQQQTSLEAIIEPHISESWFADCVRLNAMPDDRAAALETIFARIPVETAFVRLRRDGETVALGLGVLDQGWVGLFDIVTDESARQQGIGSALIEHLLHWGKDQGANGAYLQVMVDNAPAFNLYAKLGFTAVYHYWYFQNRI